MTDQPLRAAVIGMGVGDSHAKAYANNRGVQLTALCDLSEVRLAEIADKYHIPVQGRFTDYKKLLDEIKPDLVSICLPNALHAEASIAALEAGAHVICEKPMASTVAQAQAMIETAKQVGKRLMIAYNWRYRPDVQWIYRLVRTGKLGKIYHAHASWRRETGIPGSDWVGNRELAGGGALIDLGVHVLDMTMWMLDFPAVKTVSGDTRMMFGHRGMKTQVRRNRLSAERIFDVDDGAVGFIRFANDTNIVLQATWAEHREPKDDIIRLELQGTDGTINLNISNYGREDTLRFYTEIEGEPVTITPTIRWNVPYAHEALIIDLVDSLRNNTPPPTDGWQGLVATQILEAMYQSAHSGHEIPFAPVNDPIA